MYRKWNVFLTFFDCYTKQAGSPVVIEMQSPVTPGWRTEPKQVKPGWHVYMEILTKQTGATYDGWYDLFANILEK